MLERKKDARMSKWISRLLLVQKNVKWVRNQLWSLAFIFNPLGQVGFSASRWVTSVYVQNPPSQVAETPHSRFLSQDMATFFCGMGKVASTGLPLCLPSWCLELNSRKGEDGQQGNLLCFVIVGVTNGATGLLASVASHSGELGPSCHEISHRMPFPGTSTLVSLYSIHFSSLPAKKSGSSTVVSSIKLNK